MIEKILLISWIKQTNINISADATEVTKLQKMWLTDSIQICQLKKKIINKERIQDTLLICQLWVNTHLALTCLIKKKTLHKSV